MVQRTTLTVLTAAMAFFTPLAARAETGDALYFSSNAAMSAGAVTAETRDIGAIWYNPAGLAGSVKNQLSLSGSVYGVRFRSLPEVLRSRLPGGYRAASLDSSDIFSIPNASAYARRINEDVSVGFGIYVTERDPRTALTTDRYFVPLAKSGLPFAANVRQHLDASLDHTKYALGPAVGWSLTPKLRIGASVFLTYTMRTVTTGYQVDVTQADAQSPATQFVMSQNRLSFTEAGLVSTVGIQWDPAPTWKVGLTLRSPEHRFYSKAEGEFVAGSGLAIPGEQGRAILVSTPADALGNAGLRTPPRIVLAASHVFDGGIVLSAEGDYRPVLRSTATQVLYRNVVNARVGSACPSARTCCLERASSPIAINSASSIRSRANRSIDTEEPSGLRFSPGSRRETMQTRTERSS